MVNQNDTHLKSVGYILWLFGFTGSHRFYYGKPITGTIWFFTLGLLGIGWLIDLFLIPSMDRRADVKFQTGRVNYSVAWILLTFLGCSGSTGSTWASGSRGSSTCSRAACSSLAICGTTGP
jgi:TM2 domain-containing membrane protein YozV